MAELWQKWRFPADDYQRAIGQALLQRARLQDEGHASVIERARDEAGKAILVITVTPGRPKGWSDVYGNDDLDSPNEERAHFGLDLPRP